MQAQGVLHIKIRARTLLPARASAQARFAARVVFPTPPFGEHTQINGMSQSSPGVISVTDLYLLLPAARFWPQKMGKTLRRRRGRRTRPDCRSRDADRYRLRSSLRNRRLGSGRSRCQALRQRRLYGHCSSHVRRGGAGCGAEGG